MWNSSLNSCLLNFMEEKHEYEYVCVVFNVSHVCCDCCLARMTAARNSSCVAIFYS